MNINTVPVLSMCNVSKKFGGIQAVDDVSCNIAHGERRLFIGTNGAGKTTLFNLVTGDFAVTSGKIFLKGKEITNMPTHKRMRMGMRRTYQTSALFDSLTVTQNLYLSLLGERPRRDQFNLISNSKKDKAKRELAEKTLGMIQLHEKRDVIVSELSHGERKQLEFGQAIITGPQLLLLDEPAAGLSPNERNLMVSLIKSLDKDITVVLIEHDMDIAFAIADYITVMHDGAVIAEGTVKEIKGNQLVQDIYLGGILHVDSDTKS